MRALSIADQSKRGTPHKDAPVSDAETLRRLRWQPGEPPLACRDTNFLRFQDVFPSASNGESETRDFFDSEKQGVRRVVTPATAQRHDAMEGYAAPFGSWQVL